MVRGLVRILPLASFVGGTGFALSAGHRGSFPPSY
jgi:hypothetical protein